jgi:hypothetical protein
MTLHAYEYACERKAHAQPDSFAVTGVLCAVALVANMPHAIRRSLQAGACGNDSAGEQMRTRTQDACAAAARFRTLVVGACIATRVMADMVLSYSCHALLSAYEQSAQAAEATACMRVRMWALARACSCAAVVLRLLRHASVRSCVCEYECVSVSVCMCVCVCARTRRARVCM